MACPRFFVHPAQFRSLFASVARARFSRMNRQIRNRTQDGFASAVCRVRETRMGPSSDLFFLVNSRAIFQRFYTVGQNQAFKKRTPQAIPYEMMAARNQPARKSRTMVRRNAPVKPRMTGARNIARTVPNRWSKASSADELPAAYWTGPRPPGTILANAMIPMVHIATMKRAQLATGNRRTIWPHCDRRSMSRSRRQVAMAKIVTGKKATRTRIEHQALWNSPVTKGICRLVGERWAINHSSTETPSLGRVSLYFLRSRPLVVPPPALVYQLFPAPGTMGFGISSSTEVFRSNSRDRPMLALDNEIK